MQPAPLELTRAVIPAFQCIQNRKIGELANSTARRDSERIALERVLEKESR
jgi:hypothetical protein